ncbi:MAG TPA: pitrilysin family protein [Blastocatellia bacterium]|nr:pitrilysin family protein [Blastocatellia bacterium]
MQKVFRLLTAMALGLSVLVSSGHLFGQSAGGSSVKLNVVEHKFKNGLRLLMVERHDTPVISSHIVFNVGSVDERPGLTGTSHILGHMMFKGTTTIQTTNYEAEIPLMQEMDGIYAQIRVLLDKRTNSTFTEADAAKVKELRAQIDALQEQEKKYTVQNDLDVITAKRGFNGLNASTGNDTTQYVETFPSNQLEVWAYFESERIHHPVFREFYSEKDVVMEERRLSTDNVPQGRLQEAFEATAFTAHPYHEPVVGWMTDLDTVTRQQVADYFKTYYAPNNTTIVLVGDLNPDEVIKLIEKYFGSIPSQTPPEGVHVVEPEQHGERRVTVKFDASPSLLIGWHVPNVLHPDGATLSVISSILTSGRTGRLFKGLVLDQQIASNVASNYGTTKYPTMFRLSGAPRNQKSLEDLEKALLAEIDKLKKEPISDEELQKVRNQIDANFARGLESNAGLASALGTSAVVLGDWHQILTLNERRRAVTAADIQRVAQKYFTTDNLTVAYLVRESNGPARQNRRGNPGQGMEKSK